MPDLMPSPTLIWNMSQFSEWCLRQYVEAGTPYGKNAEGLKRWAREMGYVDAYISGLMGEPLEND